MAEHHPSCPGPPDETYQGQCDAWCAGHEKCEYPAGGPTYERCFECGHFFVTAEELVEADLALAVGCGVEDAERRPVAAILACPVCAHDF